MDTGLKRELIQALGTQWQKKTDKGYPKNFSPNNIKTIIITSQGVVIQYHISINGQPLIKIHEVRTRETGTRLTPNFINTILKARVMGCLEELYIEDALVYGGYADLNEMQYLLAKSRDPKEPNGYRLRFIGTIVGGTDLRMIKQACESSTGISCLALNPMIQPFLNITFQSPNNQGDKYIKYYNLVPQSYWLDRTDGELDRHFKSLTNKVLDMQFETGLKALIKKDYDNLDKVEILNNYRKNPSTDGRRAIRDCMLTVFKKMYSSYGMSNEYLNKLLSEMSLANPDKLKSVYTDYELIGIYNKGAPINRQKVMQLLNQKNNLGLIQLPKVVVVLLEELKKVFPDKGIKISNSFSENMKQIQRVSLFDKPKEKKKDDNEIDPLDFVDQRAIDYVNDIYRMMGLEDEI